MVRWLTALSRQGVRSDVFLYLDMARWPMSYPHYHKKNWIKVAVLGGTVWRSATEETPLADLKDRKAQSELQSQNRSRMPSSA